jgi:hypothetical protein
MQSKLAPSPDAQQNKVGGPWDRAGSKTGREKARIAADLTKSLGTET